MFLFKNKNLKTSNKSLSQQALKRILKNKLAIMSIIFLVSILIFNFLGPFFSPYSYNDIDVSLIKQPPSISHLLGTDDYGRDVLTRLMYAGRISLTVGLASMILSLLLGSILGCLSGYYGGILDIILMRLSDILMSIPGLPLLIIIAALLSELKVPSDYRLYIVMLMLSFVGWPGLARMVRGQVLSLREQNFMKAADILGLSDKRKIFHHLLPNTFPLLIVVATLSTADGILSESSLSFLGLGVIPPTPSWGNMINAANNLIDFQKRSWLWIPPGLAIFLTVISINLLGDALRDALDPKMKGR
ncbi:peptide ABC transporter permease [Clostridium acetobutylicum]|nr:peptide ABC transporter permease [Clostridium acetobutylicum]